MIERVFWGWDRPVMDQAVRLLTQDWISGALDLSDTLIIVPTSEAARRLKEALARKVAPSGGAVSAPHVWPPERALLSDDDRRSAASPSQLILAWARVLLDAQLADLPHLFPVAPAQQDWSWAVEMARALTDLATTLGAGGHSFASVANHPDLPRDTARWQELAGLETAWLTTLATFGTQDPQLLKRQRVAAPVLPADLRRILVLPAPDLPVLFHRWLTAAAQQVPVTLYIQAPESQAAHFDDTGSPRREHWGERAGIVIPLPGDHIHLEHNPGEQARRALDLMRQLLPQRIALGVCDAEAGAHLQERLQHEEVRVYEPGGRSAERHGTLQLLALWSDLCATDDWQVFASLLRFPAVRDALSDTRGAEAMRVLEAADDFASRHLPVTLSHALELASSLRDDPPSKALHMAMQRAQAWCQRFQDQALPEAAHALVMDLFGEISYAADSAEHRDHVSLLQDWLAACRDWQQQARQLRLPTSGPGLFSLSLQQLRQQRLADPRGDVDLVLLGWLELLWEPAPALIITGFNEESVPGTLISHPFLPDRLREALGIASQASRFARDAYLLRAMAEQRRTEGALHLTLGQWSEGKDALRPSRLLFLCSDDQLTERVRQLFPKELDSTLPREPARSRAWKLKPPMMNSEPLSTISASRLRSYLTCPFGYYLDHVLKVSPVDATKREMDALDFGNLIHHALRTLHSAEGVAAGADEAKLNTLLAKAAEAYAHARHGKRLPVPVALQLDSAKQRLRRCAEIEASLRAQGWRTQQVETSFGDELDSGLLIGGARFHGIIDRVDVNNAGQTRIIDYKTGDDAKPPLAAHAKAISARMKLAEEDEWKCFTGSDGQTYLWLDLQLPLYAHAWKLSHPDSVIETAYWNLPKAADSTSLDGFDDLDETMIAAAVACAEEAVRRIHAGMFWPPAKRSRADQYTGLIHGSVLESVTWPGANS